MCDRQYEEIRQIGENSISQNIEKMVFGEGAVTVYNTLSWSRDQVVQLRERAIRL